MKTIEARGLRKDYVSKKSRVQTVFENLRLVIQSGEFVTLIGPSGCGKSTLLRILGGLESPSEGHLVNQFQRQSFVFQEPRLLPWRTCEENILLSLEIQNSQITDENRKKCTELLSLLGLSQAQMKFPHELSGGMKMRASLARSLILSPEFLLLDEPFAALDETTRYYLQDELRSLFETQQFTVAFVTHSIEEACFLSDRIYIFSKNRNQLIEHQSSLPKKRDPLLREDLRFFEEVKKVRHLFQKEALS